MEYDYESDYYLSREAKERELARKAIDPAVARIHLELAETYAAKAQAAQPRSKVSTS